MQPASLRISLSEPCHVSWDTMTTVDDSRRHCASCDRIVQDFTKMSDAELVAFFASTKKFCGRFSEAQLSRELIPQTPKHNRKFTWLLPALLFGAPAFAQTAQPHPVQHVQPKQKKTVQPLLLTVEGVVRDEATGIPLAGANVTLWTSSDTLTLKADGAGKFCATLPRIAGDSILIEATLPDYSFFSRKVSTAEGYVFFSVQLEGIQKVIVQPQRIYAGAPIIETIDLQPRYSFFYRLFHWHKIRKAKKNYLE